MLENLQGSNNMDFLIECKENDIPYKNGEDTSVEWQLRIFWRSNISGFRFRTVRILGTPYSPHDRKDGELFVIMQYTVRRSISIKLRNLLNSD